MGAGYVTWASEVDPLAALGEVPEVLACSFKDPQLWERKYSAVAIGPGLGVGRETAHLIEHLKKEKHQAVVLDADAISACLQFNLFPLPENWVVTPHTGELARVLGISYQEIERDRYNFALAGSRKIGCHVLLKGYRTILAYENRCMVIMSGNSALSKAGTGDVLTGMIAGLMAQGVSSLQSAATAAYIHGRMADEWVRSGLDRRTLLASDIRDQLPDLISRLADGALA
jgi:NAD(P)H-hydrate epimerase